MKNYRRFGNNIHASGLPLRREIKMLVDDYHINSVIDLSDRPRSAVKRACADFGISYYKFAVDEYNPKLYVFSLALMAARCGNCLIHCYRGIHRTGILLQLLGLEKIDIKRYKNHKQLLRMI